jgi:23S rRNA pseudouridine2605 synthase
VGEKASSRKFGLARTLSKLGFCSRSRAEDMIRAGRVSLNGKIRLDPETPVSKSDHLIAIDGKVIEPRPKIYLMMNKPRGILTTVSDEKDRPTVYGVLNNGNTSPATAGDKAESWVAPVGRLDRASEGLLLMTNDSEWAASITDPETHLDKTYHVQIGTVADDEFVHAIVRGLEAKDGEVLRAKQARLLRAGQKNCWLEIILDEGKNRQIRRMIEGLGVEVLRLIRVAVGPLQLGDLGKGQFRSLTGEEKQMIDRALQERIS